MPIIRIMRRNLSLLNTSCHSRTLEIIIWPALCENVVSGIRGQRSPRSVWASAKSDQDLNCPLIESLRTVKHKEVLLANLSSYRERTVVTTTAFVPKYVAIKLNLLL